MKRVWEILTIAKRVAQEAVVRTGKRGRIVSEVSQSESTAWRVQIEESCCEVKKNSDNIPCIFQQTLVIISRHGQECWCQKKADPHASF